MRKIIIYLIFILTSFTVNGQVFSPQTLVSETPDEPYAIISADLNNDGYDDVIYSSIQDNKISCNLFNPDSNKFSQTIVLGTEFHYCTSLFAADLDNDGLKDILAISQTGNKTGWYKNTGNGNFQLQPYFTTSYTMPSAITASDVDMDGDNDVVCIFKQSESALLLINDGNDNFDSTANVGENLHIPVALCCTDVTGDGYPEIIIGNGLSDDIVYFKNNGGTSFNQQYDTVTQGQIDYVSNIIAVDLDNDGYNDIVSTSKNDNKLAWYKNIDGSGNFSSQFVITDTLSLALGLASADFDLDGDIDLVATSPNNNLIIAYINDNLNFTPFLISSETKEPNGVATGDFNSDGMIDIVSCDSWSSGYKNMIYWFKNGAGAFKVHNINKTISSWRIATDDYDNDGDIDVFYSDGSEIRWVVNNNNGNDFSDEHILFQAGYNIYDMKFTDIDNDNRDDLFVADAMGDVLMFFKNLETTFIGPIYIDQNCDGPASIDFYDIDNDGDQDFISAIVNANQIALYKNDGGSFSKEVLANVSSPLSARFFDLDNDGDRDIVFSNATGIAILKNTGDNNFENTGEVVDFGTYSDNVKAVDLNNDGYTDIICNPDYVHWLINNHDGTFTDHVIETWGGSYSVEAGDMDNDGFDDIISSSGFINRAYYIENINAADSFEIKTYALDAAIRQTQIADLNNDGYNDFVIGSWPDENLSWAESFLFRIISSPVDVTTCAGNNAFFSVLTAGAKSMKWQMNNGSGWEDIDDNGTFEGTGKAELNITSIPQNLFGNKFRCKVTDKFDSVYYSGYASIYEKQTQIMCIDDQTKDLYDTDTYVAQNGEFDPDSVINQCGYNIVLSNSYNNMPTLDSASFPAGNYVITWYLKDPSGTLLDSCSFNLLVNDHWGIDENSNSFVKLSPNPVSGNLNVKLPVLTNNVNIEIYDVTGNRLLNKKFNSNIFSLDLSFLDKGVYLIKIASGKINYTGKIIKE